ncbi:MAG: ATP-binding protein [Gammaproteobacteria bacterium]|nr:ATP-binding protein [Gammaproteobacteria bacterium]
MLGESQGADLPHYNNIVYAEQVKMLYGPAIPAALATIAAALLLIFAQWQVIEPNILFGWLAMITVVAIARTLLATYYKRCCPTIEESGPWGTWFIIGVLFTGISWGSASILLFPTGNPTHQALLAFVLLGMCSGAVTNLSAVRAAYIAFIVPTLLPIMPLLYLEDTRLSMLLIFMLCLAFIFLLQGTNYIYKGTQQNIRLRIDAINREQQVVLAKDAAEKANNAKSDFLSRMSHELRTPLNAILGFSQLLQTSDTEPLTKTQNDNIDEILIAGRHLLDLINEILDLAKIESGKLDIYCENISLNEVLNNCIALIQPEANNRKISINNNYKLENKLDVYADPKRLKQVLLNLLSNAVKYNNKNGSITIDTEHQDDYLRLTITDTGQGISPKQQQKLFKSFERLHDREHTEGTGIGLVITKHLVELMDGRIGLQSRPDKGSSFWIELKLAR